MNPTDRIVESGEVVALMEGECRLVEEFPQRRVLIG